MFSSIGAKDCELNCNRKAFNYPQLLDALKSLPAEHMILDGEIHDLVHHDFTDRRSRHSSFAFRAGNSL
jgi:hypothetical protein